MADGKSWSYRGTEITMNDTGMFVAQHCGEFIRLASLAAVKKKIDGLSAFEKFQAYIDFDQLPYHSRVDLAALNVVAAFEIDPASKLPPRLIEVTITRWNQKDRKFVSVLGEFSRVRPSSDKTIAAWLAYQRAVYDEELMRKKLAEVRKQAADALPEIDREKFMSREVHVK